MACAGRGSPPFFTPRMRPHYFQVINLIRRGCTSEGVERGGGRGVGVFFLKSWTLTFKRHELSVITGSQVLCAMTIEFYGYVPVDS